MYIRIYVYICFFPSCLLSPLCEKTSLHIYVNACTVVWTIGGNSWTEWRSMTFFSIFFFRCSLERGACVMPRHNVSPSSFFCSTFWWSNAWTVSSSKKSVVLYISIFMSQRERRKSYIRQTWVCTDSWYILGVNSSAGSFCHISSRLLVSI